MFRMAYESGKITSGCMDKSRPQLKPDQTVLTVADTKVSALIKKELTRYLKSGDHLLIDEEDPDSPRYFNQSLWESTPYIWAVDPIDGTRAFANQMPLYGISIGLLRERKPWLGLVYFPGFQELFYCDGTKGYFVTHAFSRNEKKRLIKPVDQQISQQSLFLGSDSLFQLYDWDFNFCQVLLPSCAVIALCWPAIGRGCGCFFNAHLWDFAGAWPIFRCAGLELRSIKTGKEATRLDTDLFKGQGAGLWRMKEPHILSSRRNHVLIRKSLSQKSP